VCHNNRGLCRGNVLHLRSAYSALALESMKLIKKQIEIHVKYKWRPLMLAFMLACNIACCVYMCTYAHTCVCMCVYVCVCVCVVCACAYALVREAACKAPHTMELCRYGTAVLYCLCRGGA